MHRRDVRQRAGRPPAAAVYRQADSRAHRSRRRPRQPAGTAAGAGVLRRHGGGRPRLHDVRARGRPTRRGRRADHGLTVTPPVAFSPYDYRIHEDPYPVYARLRDEAPLYRNDDLDFWALSRHADVVAAFRDPARFSSANGVSLDPSAWGPYAHRTMSFLALDPPRHTRMRALVAKAFTPRRTGELEGRIRALSRQHLTTALRAGPEFDFVADFASLLPMDVISELIGVPPADRAELRRLADTVVHREDGLFDVPQAGMEAALTLAGYYADLIAGRRARPPGPAA